MTADKNTNKRENLLEEIKSRIAAVEKAIGHVENSEKDSEEAVNKIKYRILNSINNLHDLLNLRETQLERQVELQTSRLKLQLHSQQTHLHQVLGSLKSSLRCAETLPDSALNSVMVESIDSCKNLLFMSSKNPAFLKFDMNEEPLKDQIKKLGEVQFPLAVGLSSEQLNWLNICEYGDDSQPLLHKTLEESPVKIRVAFPKLSSRTEDWLNKLSQQQTNGEMNHVPLKYSLPAVQEWLKSVRQETGEEPIEVDGFEVVDSRKSSESSDSLEILSHPCSLGSGMCCQQNEVYFNSSPYKRAGSKNANAMEIEDICTSSSSAEQGSKDFLNRICRANEPCSSFMECACEENCAAVAIRDMRKTKKETNRCFAEILKPIESMTKNTWLRSTTTTPPQKNNAEWLQKPTTPTQKDADNMWLQSSNSSSQTVVFPTILQQTDCWLKQDQSPATPISSSKVQYSATEQPKVVDVKQVIRELFAHLDVPAVWLQQGQAVSSGVNEVTDKMKWLANGEY